YTCISSCILYLFYLYIFYLFFYFFFFVFFFFFFSSRRRHTRSKRDWSSDVCSSDLEVLVVLVADPDVAGIDAVLVERFRARRVLGEEHVPVVVEVADDRGCDPEIANAPDHFGNGRSEERRVGKECGRREARTGGKGS